MRPILIIVGLVVGAMIGGKLATLFGGDYLATLTYESPDQQSDLYYRTFITGVAIFGALGGILGLIASLFIRSK